MSARLERFRAKVLGEPAAVTPVNKERVELKNHLNNLKKRLGKEYSGYLLLISRVTSVHELERLRFYMDGGVTAGEAEVCLMDYLNRTRMDALVRRRANTMT